MKYKNMNGMAAGIPNSVRRGVYKRDGWRCALCDSTDGLQIHHVRPRGKGGADHPMNLITLCWRCHAMGPSSKLTLGWPPNTRAARMETWMQQSGK